MMLGEHDDVVVFDSDGRCRFQRRGLSPVLKFGLTRL